MTFATEHTILEDYFDSSWSDRTPVKYQGLKYAPRQGVAYAEFKVLPGGTGQITIGGSSNTHRHIGYINVDFYAPLGKNLSTIKGHVDTASAIFRGTNIASATIQCGTPRYYDHGEDDGWYKITMEVPYRRDENF